jgi:hypothetical protein
MFDLEPAIAGWRRQMLVAGIATPVPLEELENHLREDIDAQVRDGAMPEQAFASAIKRIGDPGPLIKEFAQANDSATARRRNLKRLGSIIAGTAFAYSTVFVIWLIEWRLGKIQIAPAEWLLVFGSMAATLSFGFTGRYFAKFLPTITGQWWQALAIVAGIFAVAALFRIVWAFLPLSSLVQAQIVILWTLSPLLGFGNLAAGWIERCAAERKQLNPTNA